TAAVLLPPVLAVVLLAGPLAFAVALGAFLLLAGWEWLRLSSLRSRPLRLLWLAALALLAAASHRLLPPAAQEGLVLAGAVFWVATLLWLRHPGFAAGPGLAGCLLKAASGSFALLVAWLALVLLRERLGGPAWVLYLLGLVWAADIGAFFAGRALGGARLAPRISPGKTWAGFLGGMGAALLLAAICGPLIFALEGRALAGFLGVSLLSALASVIGDLFESLIKRQVAEKDSGRLLPGHGGMSDRVDSLLAAAPVFTGGLIWLSR
ncbi:MAG: phosphatidate cytidylyltransferase, partial [Geminicoccaceae bacterium]|nr:phosphatidate cytidylyltransferase [Geminicoccaceae bacterium]